MGHFRGLSRCGTPQDVVSYCWITVHSRDSAFVYPRANLDGFLFYYKSRSRLRLCVKMRCYLYWAGTGEEQMSHTVNLCLTFEETAKLSSEAAALGGPPAARGAPASPHPPHRLRPPEDDPLDPEWGRLVSRLSS